MPTRRPNEISDHERFEISGAELKQLFARLDRALEGNEKLGDGATNLIADVQLLRRRLAAATLSPYEASAVASVIDELSVAGHAAHRTGWGRERDAEDRPPPEPSADELAQAPPAEPAETERAFQEVEPNDGG